MRSPMHGSFSHETFVVTSIAKGWRLRCKSHYSEVERRLSKQAAKQAWRRHCNQVTRSLRVDLDAWESLPWVPTSSGQRYTD